MRTGRRQMAKRSLRITARFAIVLVVLVPALLAILGVGLQGLQSGRHWANTLYADRLVTSQTVTDLDIALEDAHEATLELLLADNAADRQRLTNSLLTQISPRVENALAAVTRQVADNPGELAATQTVTAHWAHFQQLLVTVAAASASPAARSATANQVTTMLDAASNSALSIIRMEGIQGKKAHEAALGVYRSSVILMLLAGALGLICTVGVVGWLIRSVLPRTLAYSAFAADVSRGDYSGHLRPSGDDELAQLGRVLETLAQRREAEDAYDHRQLELIETLQLTESQQEANDLLKRHLERAVSGNQVTILNRDNGADRLQAVTAMAPESPLAAALQSATPARASPSARPHRTPRHPTTTACSAVRSAPAARAHDVHSADREWRGHRQRAVQPRVAPRRSGAAINPRSRHPRRPGDGQPAQPRDRRAACHDRQPHRAAEQAGHQRCDAPDGRAVRSHQDPAGRADVRPGPFQVDQRRVRPRRGRQRACSSRCVASPARSGRATSPVATAARSSWSCCRIPTSTGRRFSPRSCAVP